MSDLVRNPRNPEDRFSRDAVHIISKANSKVADQTTPLSLECAKDRLCYEAAIEGRLQHYGKTSIYTELIRV